MHVILKHNIQCTPRGAAHSSSTYSSWLSVVTDEFMDKILAIWMIECLHEWNFVTSSGNPFSFWTSVGCSSKVRQYGVAQKVHTIESTGHVFKFETLRPNLIIKRS